MSYHLFSQVVRKARKSHSCIWCGQPINPGDTYTHEQSIYDGCHQNHKWHAECLYAFDEEFKSGHSMDFDAYANERPILPVLPADQGAQPPV